MSVRRGLRDVGVVIGRVWGLWVRVRVRVGG